MPPLYQVILKKKELLGTVCNTMHVCILNCTVVHSSVLWTSTPKDVLVLPLYVKLY